MNLHGLRIPLIVAATSIALSCEPSKPWAVPRVEAVVNPSEVLERDTVTISIRIRNTSGLPMFLEFAHGCALEYSIVDSSGRIIVGAGGGGCTQAIVDRTLAPGDSMVRRFRWVAPITHGWERYPVPTQEYRVIAEPAFTRSFARKGYETQAAVVRVHAR